VKVTVTFSDGKTITITSHSQSVYMLPWTIETNVANTETFNRDISLALGAILPVGSTNRERIVSDYVGIALATVVMNTIEPQWKLMAAEGKAADALIEIRRKYQVIGADVNPNHDVTFGVYSQRHGGVEENLHAIVRRSLFPKNLTEEAILLYKNGKVRGVDEFSNGSSRYEDLVLSVPWLSQLWKQYPRWPITLLWVHDVSLSDKGMRQFSADMHKLRKDALADEVRKVQRDVAVLNVSYGDWWLVLPDKRMVLWRYESVSGLLGFKQSQISAAECTDYQGVTGGCVGAVISPDGQFIQ
jgi:hypothetical protein